MCINYFRKAQGKPKIITDSKTGVPLYTAKFKKKNLKAESHLLENTSHFHYMLIVLNLLSVTEGGTRTEYFIDSHLR